MPTTGAALLVFASFGAASGQPRAGGAGFSTGSMHRVRLPGRPSLGLEVGMPRSGPYARAIQLDLRFEWAQSAQSYRRARDEFKRTGRSGRRWQAMSRGWVIKAEFQRELSGRLTRLAQRSYRMTASSYLARAAALQQKWLAIRAFTGRKSKRIGKQVLADFKAAIQRGSRYYADRARLGLAAFLHENGATARARRVFRHLRPPLPSWLALLEAQYYVSAGRPTRALAALERAFRYSKSFRRQARRSNSFDALRTDPRFRRLLRP